MMIATRRGFIAGLAAMVASPAIVRADSLMKLPARKLVHGPAIYCNRTIRHLMDVQTIRDRNVLDSSLALTGDRMVALPDNWSGKYRGIPIMIDDYAPNGLVLRNDRTGFKSSVAMDPKRDDIFAGAARMIVRTPWMDLH